MTARGADGGRGSLAAKGRRRSVAGLGMGFGDGLVATFRRRTLLFLPEHALILFCSGRYRVATTGFPEGPARQTADTILGVGDKVFDLVAATSYTSSWFEREPPQPRK